MTMFEMTHLRRVGPMGQLAPDAMAGFKTLDEAALTEGAIPKKYKELMGIAVALTTQCLYCIEVHRKAAVAAGASDAELAETVFVATARRRRAHPRHAPVPRLIKSDAATIRKRNHSCSESTTSKAFRTPRASASRSPKKG